MANAKPQITQFINSKFSSWRRKLNPDYYAYDIDQIISTEESMGSNQLTLTNEECIPLAFIEIKYIPHRKTINLNSFQFQLLKTIANRCESKLFLLLEYEYNPNDLCFYVVGVNQLAKDFLIKIIGSESTYLSERDYYCFECNIRKRKGSDKILSSLNTFKTRFELPEIK